MKGFILGIIITLIVLAVGVGAYMYGKKNVGMPSLLSPSPISVSTPTFSPEPIVDIKSIEEVIKEQIVAKRGSSANELTIKVSKNDGQYAQGGASSTGGGGMWFAAKVGNNWKLVWDGNGVILCSDLKDYPNFPTSMISECYDSTTNKSVKR